MTLPPDSPITPVTACTMPGRSGQDRVTTSCAFSVMRSSLTRFIPTNEAGAGFAGDATGCGVGLLLDVARSRHCGRGGSPDRHRHGFTPVSRAFHEPPRLATTVSRALHACTSRHRTTPADTTADTSAHWATSIGLSCRTLRCRTATPGNRASIRLTPKLPLLPSRGPTPWTGCYDAKQ